MGAGTKTEGVREQLDHVTVRLFAAIRDSFGEKEIPVASADAPDISRLIEVICSCRERRRAILDEAGMVRPEIAVLVNGRNIAFLGGMQAALRAGDEVAIFPPMYGG